MRYSLTLSLPPEMIGIIDNEVATGRYLSKSEFIRDLLRDWEKKNLKTAQLKKERLPANKVDKSPVKNTRYFS